MIRLMLLTGFLGAGKTTLMKNILDEFAGEKVGMIVNEFGETGVDGALLARQGVLMSELANGSIFCACIKENFLQSLIDMSKPHVSQNGKHAYISHLFIETSGLADPSEMGRILEVIMPLCDKGYDYRGAVCLVDAETFLELSDLLPALTRQVEYCGAAIINKADLVDEERLKLIAETITQLNPGCEIIVTSYSRLDVSALMDRLSPVEKAPIDSTNTPETRPSSFVLKPAAQAEFSVEGLHGLVKELSPYAYRIKGFLPTADGVAAINSVGGHTEIDPWTEPYPGYALVVISSIGIGVISKITKALDDAEFKGKLCL
ncbi:MAG: GTP-binding protein [Defluviitaleaceae bacterium]|nr:GTP-binding protein [Defluviitaleaceae bacterium]